MSQYGHFTYSETNLPKKLCNNLRLSVKVKPKLKHFEIRLFNNFFSLQKALSYLCRNILRI